MSAALGEADRALVAAAAVRDKRALGKLVSRLETPAPQERAQGPALVRALAAARGARPPARLLGLTGPPGAGKSTLVGQLAPRLVAGEPPLAVAVLAIDPASVRSGGALLGDRVRVDFAPGEPRLYFRSQSSAGTLGGLSPHTLDAVRVLEQCFDLVVIETVGVGQSERDVTALADATLLVTTPLAGDRLQGLKAGLLELVDGAVMHKADTPGATRALRELTAALAAAGRELPAWAASARTGHGLEPLLAWCRALPAVEAARRLEQRQQLLARRLGETLGPAVAARALASAAAEQPLAARAAADPAWDLALELALTSPPAAPRGR